MSSPESATIYALSSGRPPAAIAVLRVSGPGAGEAVRQLCGQSLTPREAALAILRDPATGDRLDQALVLWFPGPASETGEDMAEFQVHGGRAVIAATLAALGRLDGMRPAEAGEFTRRALANGKLDLTAVEGLADLIGAETEAQRRQALGQLRGLLGQRAAGWRARIIAAMALIEAGLDFSDEGDVPEETVAPAQGLAAHLASEIGEVLAAAARGRLVRDGITIAIAGPVNAGKSSLFNWLAGRDAAIVSPHPGTTRDVLELHLDLGGYQVTVLDTAGLRDSADPVEQEGIRRAAARADEAELVLWMADASAAAGWPEPAVGPEARHWRVLNKVDLLGEGSERAADGDGRGNAGTGGDGQTFAVSARTGQGLPELLVALEGAAAALAGGEAALVTRERQRLALERAHAALERAAALPAKEEVLVAEELRLAARALDQLVGRVDIEDVLDSVFRDFCIGK